MHSGNGFSFEIMNFYEGVGSPLMVTLVVDILMQEEQLRFHFLR